MTVQLVILLLPPKTHAYLDILLDDMARDHALRAPRELITPHLGRRGMTFVFEEIEIYDEDDHWVDREYFDQTDDPYLDWGDQFLVKPEDRANRSDDKDWRHMFHKSLESRSQIVKNLRRRAAAKQKMKTRYGV